MGDSVRKSCYKANDSEKFGDYGSEVKSGGLGNCSEDSPKGGTATKIFIKF